ncbi:MAG: glycosyltransferase family 4 protein [Verrucomicrobiae bacterium]|nr:glycosyltransferase family 4 protein [Verrucomicrobiae bacterium]
MRLAVDTNATFTTRAGVARYIRGLLQGLRTLDLPQGWSVEEFAWPVENFAFRQPRRAWRTFYRECLWTRTVAPRHLRSRHIRLLHSTAAPLLIPPRGIHHVVTVHDIAFLTHPDRFRPWHRRMAVRGLARARRADCIVCISRFTADELVRHAGFDPGRLRVVHNGCGLPAPVSPLPPLPQNLRHPFFLFVGSLEPGKNLALLRQSYELARQSGRPLPDLAIVGARFPGLAAEGPPPPNWHYLGHLPDPDLAALYSQAVALLFPSRYEGFGLPVAEAMSLGCPVVCSPVSSLTEVAADAALLVPQEPAAYLDAALQLATLPSLRLDLVHRGRQRALHFTWERCARQTLDVYREALGA